MLSKQKKQNGPVEGRWAWVNRDVSRQHHSYFILTKFHLEVYILCVD